MSYYSIYDLYDAVTDCDICDFEYSVRDLVNMAKKLEMNLTQMPPWDRGQIIEQLRMNICQNCRINSAVRPYASCYGCDGCSRDPTIPKLCIDCYFYGPILEGGKCLLCPDDDN